MRVAAIGLVVVGLASGCVTKPTRTTTTSTSTSSSIPDGSTTIPDGATVLTGRCTGVTVPPDDLASTAVTFDEPAEELDASASIQVLDVSLEWDAASNEDVGVVLSSTDDAYAVLVVGAAGAGASVTLRDDSPVRLADAPVDAASGRVVGDYAPAEDFGELGTPSLSGAWTLEVGNLSESAEVTLSSCAVRLLVI